MRLTGGIDIAAPPARVWETIVEPTSLASCVPGVGDLRAVDERTFEGSIRASVGPIDGDFAFTAVIERADFPDGLVVRVEGTDSVTGSRVQVAATASLTEPGPGSTHLGYEATVTMKGRLAILGEMVLRATAGLMIGQVTRCLRDRLEAGART